MFGVAPIEDRINAARAVLVQLEQSRKEKYERFEDLQQELEADQVSFNRTASRLGELELLRDIKDGKLTVLNSETGLPANILFM